MEKGQVNLIFLDFFPILCVPTGHHSQVQAQEVLAVVGESSRNFLPVLFTQYMGVSTTPEGRSDATVRAIPSLCCTVSFHIIPIPLSVDSFIPFLLIVFFLTSLFLETILNQSLTGHSPPGKCVVISNQVICFPCRQRGTFPQSFFFFQQ